MSDPNYYPSDFSIIPDIFGDTNSAFYPLFPDTAALGQPDGNWTIAQFGSAFQYVPLGASNGLASPAQVAAATGHGGGLSPTSSYPGPTLGQMLVGVGVLSGITLLLPPKYALLLPIAVLLGYTATHQQTFQTLFAYLTNLLNGIQTVASKI